MKIVVKVNKAYDLLPATDKPTQEQLNTGEYRHDAAGNLLRRQVLKRETEVEVNVPDGQIETLREYHRLAGRTDKPDKEIYADYIENIVMPQQAPRSGWVEFVVDKDKALEKYLNNRYELKEK